MKEITIITQAKHMRTAQQLFETSVACLRTQGQKSFIGDMDNYSCRYRGSDDCKCAVGCLIMDREYHEKMEGLLVHELITSGLLTVERRDEFHKHQALLSNLQHIHDNKPILTWEKQWSMLAEDHYLTLPSNP
jgi:hypothetical protein